MVPGGTDTVGTGTCKVDSGAEHASYVGVPLVKTLLCNSLQNRGKQINPDQLMTQPSNRIILLTRQKPG
jgi:hypothetical protein